MTIEEKRQAIDSKIIIAFVKFAMRKGMMLRADDNHILEQKEWLKRELDSQGVVIKAEKPFRIAESVNEAGYVLTERLINA